MKSVDFLVQELKRVYSLYSYLEIKYEYREYLRTHIIEVKPVHCFNVDKQYIDEQIKLEDVFEENFPNEEILFITENILIKIENPLLELGISSLEVIEVEPLAIQFLASYDMISTSIDNFNWLQETPPIIISPPLIKEQVKIVKKDSEYYSESFFLFNIVV